MPVVRKACKLDGNARRGLLLVYTGDGKGKTTAALGCAFRALGHGCRVAMVQFIKGPVKSGEITAVDRFCGEMDIFPMGKGFIRSDLDAARNRTIALRAWSFAKELLSSKLPGPSKYDLVILDELTYLVTLGYVETREVVQTLRARPSRLHVIVTGRHAPPALVEAADIATEMREIKHALKKGIRAQKGIDY